MVKKSENEKENAFRTWFLVFQGVLTVAFFIIGFFANRLINEIDDLQRQVNRLTVEVSVVKREMEIMNGYKKASFKTILYEQTGGEVFRGN